jgi:hypothetical protein
MVKISLTSGKIRCETLYHPEFPAAARDMGGKWAAPAWTFDARDEQRVRDLCLDLFGTDGTPCELVTLRCNASSALWDAAGTDCELYLAGRLVAKVFSKNDSRAKLGDGVVITEGGFCGGGSTRAPYATSKTGTTFELRDVPRAIADRVREESPELVEIIASPLSPAPDTIKVDPAHQALIDERAALLARLAEVDGLLAAAPATVASARTFEVAYELRDAD